VYQECFQRSKAGAAVHFFFFVDVSLCASLSSPPFVPFAQFLPFFRMHVPYTFPVSIPLDSRWIGPSFLYILRHRISFFPRLPPPLLDLLKYRYSLLTSGLEHMLLALVPLRPGFFCRTRDLCRARFIFTRLFLVCTSGTISQSNHSSARTFCITAILSLVRKRIPTSSTALPTVLLLVRVPVKSQNGRRISFVYVSPLPDGLSSKVFSEWGFFFFVWVWGSVARTFPETFFQDMYLLSGASASAPSSFFSSPWCGTSSLSRAGESTWSGGFLTASFFCELVPLPRLFS